MRKSLVCLSSGQDSATVLYDTLANTNDKVYARYIRMKHFYSKNDLGERLLGGGWIDKTINKKLSTQLTTQ